MALAMGVILVNCGKTTGAVEKNPEQVAQATLENEQPPAPSQTTPAETLAASAYIAVRRRELGVTPLGWGDANWKKVTDQLTTTRAELWNNADEIGRPTPYFEQIEGHDLAWLQAEYRKARIALEKEVEASNEKLCGRDKACVAEQRDAGFGEMNMARAAGRCVLTDAPQACEIGAAQQAAYPSK